MSQAPQHAPARRATQSRVVDRLVRSAGAFVRPATNARRAVLDDIRQDKKGWARHGITALAVSALGLAIAGSVVMTGAAQSSGSSVASQVSVATEAGVSKPKAFAVAGSTSRDAARPAIDPAKIKSMAQQRAEVLAKTDAQIAKTAESKAVDAREKALATDAAATRKQAEKIAARASSGTAVSASMGSVDVSAAPISGKTCLPVNGYTIAARFGDVGAWARYHTGIDFSAPVGTPIHAPTAGVVTNAGIGPASGWAGNYVAIRYANGTQSLMAHMSTVSVSVGQTVSACQVVGAIGMTGRTFGPHMHFEIYPAGVTPGDVYAAVNPAPWLEALGVTP